MTVAHQLENISKQIRGGKAKLFVCAPPSTREEETIV